MGMIRFLRLPVVCRKLWVPGEWGNEAMTNHGCFLGTHEPEPEPETGLFQPAFFIEAILENQVLSSDFQDVMVRIDISGCFGAECPWIRSSKRRKIHPQGLAGRPWKSAETNPKRKSDRLPSMMAFSVRLSCLFQGEYNRYTVIVSQCCVVKEIQFSFSGETNVCPTRFAPTSFKRGYNL